MAFRYTNSVDLVKVQPVLFERLKWSGDYNPSDASTASKSGRYLDDGSFHAAVDLETFKSLLPEVNVSAQELTKAKTNYLNAAILRAIHSVFERPEIIEQTAIYEIIEARGTTEVRTEDFVGFEISIFPDSMHTLQILSAILHFNAGASFNLYMFIQGESTPIWTQSVTCESGKHSVVKLTDCFVSYSGKKATKFYIGYKPSEVSATPFVDDIINLRPTIVFGAQEVYSRLPILSNTISYPLGRTGLNFEICSFRDYTDEIVNNPGVFDELIGLIHASILMELSIFTKRKNDDQRAIQDNAKYALQLDLTGTLPISDSPQIFGLRSRIKEQTRKVRESFYLPQFGVTTYAP